MTSLQLSEKAPPDWGLPLWTGGALPQGMQKEGTARETAPPPTRTLPSGSLSAHIFQ
jgi:hypothetical protein